MMKSENEIIEWIVKEIALLISVSENDVNIDDPFFNLGLSSLDVVDVAEQLEDWLGTEVDETLFFEYTTIRTLSTYLAKESPATNKASSLSTSENKENEPIAIIGMSCNFPGASSLSNYWDLLINHKSAIKEIDDSHFERPLGFKGHAGLLDDDFYFDKDVFKISKEEIKHMDPQQKHLLSLSWQAIEDAGYSPNELSNSKTGVFIGISTSDFVLEKILKTTKGNVFDGTGFAHSIAANRLSYFFNLKGPSISLDTACSSSLVALHQAISSLRSGEANMALVGGINIMMSPFLMESFHKANMLSKNGKCSTFSKEADGYVRGEGGGVILIKPLSKAIEDGNEIYSIIKGSAINQDGQTSSLTAPNLTSQVEVLNSALESSRLSIDDIHYIEAHGTGTPLGDPIEVEAISRVFKKKSNKLYIGSVKTNIGHLEAAAGIASIIKASLAIKNELIPAQINFTEINPKIKMNRHSIDILKDNQNMSYEKGKYIGVSSFGFGGTNSHVILGQAPDKEVLQKVDPLNKKPSLFPIIISASNIDCLRESLMGLSSLNTDIESISKELLYRFNSNLSHFFCVNTKSKDELDKIIRESLENLEESSNYSVNSKSNLSKVAFVLTGQGNEYCQLGLGLYENFSEFRKPFNLIIDKFQTKIEDENLIESWMNHDKFEESAYSQVILFCYQTAYIELLETFNIEVNLIIGHSFGEITASYIAGMLSLDDCIDLIIIRSKLIKHVPQGQMLVIYEALSVIKKIISIDDKKISLAIRNSKKINVISGDKKHILKAQSLLNEQNIRTKVINDRNAFHSYVFDNTIDQFKNDLLNIKHHDVSKELISCFQSKTLKDRPDLYWSKHLRSTVNFNDSMKNLFSHKPSHIIEIGPKGTLLPIVKVNLKEVHLDDVSILTSDLNSSDCLSSLFNIIYSLQNNKHPVSWKPFLRGYKRSFLRLPVSQILSKSYTHKDNYIEKTNIHTDNTDSNYKEILIKMISEEIEIPINEIKSDAPLTELGADSLVLLSCLESINEHFRVDISMADIFSDLSTIDLVSEYLEVNVKQETIQIKNHISSIESNVKNNPEQILELNEASKPDDIKNLIREQLNIMAQQLKALESISIQSQNTTTKSSIKISSGDEKEASGMGVLGNFKSRYQLDDNNNAKSSQYMNKLINEFNKHTPYSKAHAQKYRTPLADNRVSAGFRPNMKEAVYPIHFKKAKGAYFWDIDGNQYTDFTMGFGVNLFGHSPKFINKAIKDQLEKGVAVGPQSDLAGPVAEKLCKITGMERVAFLNSGTEAVMMAIRLARAKTKRETIVIFEGSYHGTFDGVLARKNKSGQSIPVAAGVPKTLTKDVIVLDYNKNESLNYIREHAHMLAAVLIEGVQSRFPELRPNNFIQKLRQITSESQTALIVDEVINGFRVHPKGIQGDLNFLADISVYGKILGGGFPIGAVAGSKEYLDFIDGGNWSFGDDSFPKNEITFFAGTFCKHPLAMSASYEVLKKIEESGNEISSSLNLKTKNLANELNVFFKDKKSNITIVYYGSLFRFKSKINIDWLIYDLNLKGFYIWEGRNMFLSTAHSDEDIELFIEAIKESFINYSSSEYKYSGKNNKLDDKSDHKNKTFNMISPQYRFCQSNSINDPYHKLANQVALCIEFKGNLNTEILKNTIQATCSRYDSFGAYYDCENKKVTFKETRTIEVGDIDLSSAPNAIENATQWLTHNAKYVLDPNEKPIKIDIIKLSDQHFYISLICHHLTTDGLSIAFMTDEFSKAYNAALNSKNVKHSKVYSFSKFIEDYHERYQQILTGQSFWNRKLKDLPDKIWHLESMSKKGSRLKQLIDEKSYKKIRTFGYKNKSSLQNTLLNIFCESLGNKYDKEELIIGLPAAGHTSIKETCVGQCVNIIPITWKKTDLPIKQKISNLKDDLLDNYKYRDYPISKMIEHTKKDFIEVLFNVEPITELPKFHGIDTNLITVPISASEYPIIVNAMRLGTSLHIEIDFQLECLDHERAKELLDDFVKRLLEL